MTQNILLLSSKALGSRINSCSRILYSNQKQKRTHHYHLWIFLSVTWIPCILIHPVYNRLWTKIIGMKPTEKMMSSLNVGYHLPFQHNELFHLPYRAVAEISPGISLRVRPEEPFLLLKYIITLSLILYSYY